MSVHRVSVLFSVSSAVTLMLKTTTRNVSYCFFNMALIQVFYYDQRMSVTLQCPGYPEDTLRSLAERLPCRETQLATLLALMGQVS